MKVKELIAELQKHNQELEVLSTDSDGWFNELSYVESDFVVDGKAVGLFEDPNAVLCVLIRTPWF